MVWAVGLEPPVLLQRRLAGMLTSDTATESAVRWRVPEALHVLFGRTAPIVRGRTAPSGTPVPDVLPEGERFLARSYSNHAGTREYRLYVPSGHRGHPRRHRARLAAKHSIQNTLPG